MMHEIICSNFHDLIDLKVLACGTQKCTPGYAFGPAVRDFFVLHYIHEGKGYYQFGNTEVALDKGDSFLIYPGMLTYYWADEKEPWHYSWVIFRGVYAEEILHRLNLHDDNLIIRNTGNCMVEDCFIKMMAADDHKKGKDLYLLGLLHTLFSTYIEQSDMYPAHCIKEDRSADYINKALEFIAYNFSKKISLSDIANHVGIERKYLCTLFKKYHNSTPYNILQSTRFDKACALLAKQDLSIEVVSRSVGYDDPLLFSKMFRRYKGFSPREYKKKFLQSSF